jgi:hypothetical protein
MPPEALPRTTPEAAHRLGPKIGVLTAHPCVPSAARIWTDFPTDSGAHNPSVIQVMRETQERQDGLPDFDSVGGRHGQRLRLASDYFAGSTVPALALSRQGQRGICRIMLSERPTANTTDVSVSMGKCATGGACATCGRASAFWLWEWCDAVDDDSHSPRKSLATTHSREVRPTEIAEGAPENAKTAATGA